MRAGPEAKIIAIDQEGHGLVWTDDGKTQHKLDAISLVRELPRTGGGLIVGDGNCWGVRTPMSVSQFGWEKQEELDAFLHDVRALGFEAVSIPNKLARTLTFRYKYDQCDAVLALWHEVTRQVSRKDESLRGHFDGGHPVRVSFPDNSFGQRAVVVRDFLRFQNTGGYESPFAEDVTKIAFDALSRDDRPLFDLKKTKPQVGSLRRIAAIAVTVYDPETGELRTYKDRPWGIGFITRRVIGLNGVMTGKGVRAPGNPMRAALRCVGRRYGDKVDRGERAAFDQLVRVLIRAFREHGPVRPVE